MTAWIFGVVLLGLVDGRLMPAGRIEIFGPYETAAMCEAARTVAAGNAHGLPFAIGPCVGKDEVALAVLRDKGLLPYREPLRRR